MRHPGPRLRSGCAAATAGTTSWWPSAASAMGFVRLAEPGERPRLPVRQWVLSLPIPLRMLLAALPRLLTPVLQVVHRAITRFLLAQAGLTAGLTAGHADSGEVTLIQRFESAANLNIHLHCLVLDGVYRCDTEGQPVFVGVPAPSDDALQTVLHKIITRLMKLLTRKPARRRALRRKRPPGAGATVPLHHAPRFGQRAAPASRHRPVPRCARPCSSTASRSNTPAR